MAVQIKPLSALRAPTKAFPCFTVAVRPLDLAKYLGACVARGVGYQLGAKADSDGRSLAAFPPRYDHIDCSGFLRAAVAWATDGGLILPDGSVNQREWCQNHGLKRSNYLALLRQDGIVRIAFIRATTTERIGHVYLCYNKQTIESYGGHGPGMRSPLAHILHALTSDVFVLTSPEVDA